MMHHLAITYGGPGRWYYNEMGPMSDISTILMMLFLAINQSFFMGFFFMVSSYFTPASVERHGAGAYTRDRLKRLGIPLLFYILVVSPLLNYVLALSRGSDQSIAEFLPRFVESLAGLDVGPLWFVETLLFFSLLYVVWWLVFGSRSVRREEEDSAPSNVAIALFAVALGASTFVLRIWLPVGWVFAPLGLQFPHFIQYIALFIVGLIAYQRGWFARLTDSQGKTWGRVVVGLIALFPVIVILGGVLEGNLDAAMGGLHWQSFAYSMWEQLMCVAMVVTLLVWFRRRFNTQNRLGRAMSTSAYATYVIHAPVIVLLALGLSGIQMDMGLKLLLLAPVAVSLSFLVGYLIKRLPLARSIL